ncbi:MAG TPA: DUF4234 domain-containing protein [Pseudomonas sp.]|nr:DUF4234 domain-containing protein [Pseudomonas sp.]
MADLKELENSFGIKTLNFVLLTIVTAGIYGIVWMFRFSPAMGKAAGKEVASEVFLIWMAVCSGLSTIFAGSGEELLDIISGLLAIAYMVIVIVFSFKAKAVLQSYAVEKHGIELRMNSFYTFLFTYFYINYCFNDIPNVKAQQEILSRQA